MSKDWASDEDQFLRDNYGKLTAHQCAMQLAGRNRGMVIGRASRLGLCSDMVGGRTIGVPRLRQHKAAGLPVTKRVANPVGVGGRKGLARSSVADMANGAAQYKQVELVASVAIDLPGLQCVGVESLIDLGPHQCRWPLDDGKWCGLDKLDAGYYCPAHHSASIDTSRRYRGRIWSVTK